MNKSKGFGQYFTPEHVADFMIDLSSSSKSARVLEPACGEGVFLELLKARGYENIVGYEIDQTLNKITDAKIVNRSFVNEKFNEKFALVIGNPPYIRWKNLDEKLKLELESNSLWQNYFNSLCDYLFIFMLKSVEILTEGGELILITPEYWLYTKHSENLRNYLVHNGFFTHIFHFNETPIFDRVASSIIIFRYVKSIQPKINRPNIKVVKYLSRQKLSGQALKSIKCDESNPKIERFESDQFSVNARWFIAPKETKKSLFEYENKCYVNSATKSCWKQNQLFRLGDIAHIGNGMVSGLDRAFQIPGDIELTTSEKKSIISVLKAKNIRQFIHGQLTSYILLNGAVESETCLMDKYPTFYKLLKRHQKKLEKRYNYKRKINYWDWVFLRNFNLFRQESDKIFVPCKERISHKNYFRFTYVSNGIFPTQDVTGIYLKPDTKESIFYILTLLNSDRVFQWLKYKGVVKGNIVEFSEKPLASIPIRD